MGNGKGKAIATAISFLLTAVFIAVTVGIVLKYTNGGNESFKTFYVQYGGEKILSTDTKKRLKLNDGQWYYFEVNYPLDVGNKESPRDYTVKIVSNENVGFRFTVDGKIYQWSGVSEDLSQYFGLQKKADSFTLFVKEGTNLKTILQNVYAEKTVSVPSLSEIGSEYLYTLIVSSYNEKITYRIELAIGQEAENGDEEEDDRPVEPPNEEDQAKDYAITYEIAYSFDDTPIAVELPTKARAGETVDFTAIPERRYEDYGVWAEVYDGLSGEFLYYATTLSYGHCSFEMPARNAHLKIYHV